MEFLEGSLPAPDQDWQVLIVSASQRDVPDAQIVPQRWPSGVTGILMRVPRTEKINAETVERLLSETFHVSVGKRVRGPDSMLLR